MGNELISRIDKRLAHDLAGLRESISGRGIFLEYSVLVICACISVVAAKKREKKEKTPPRMGHERGFRRNRGNCRGPTPIHRSINHSRSYLPSYLIVSPFFIFFSSFFFFFLPLLSLCGEDRGPIRDFFVSRIPSIARAVFFPFFFSPLPLSSPRLKSPSRVLYISSSGRGSSLSPCDSSIRFIR